MKRIVSCLLGLVFSLQLGTAATFSDTNLFQAKYTNVTRLVEGDNDPSVVKLVGLILQRSHYNGQPLNDEISGKFLDRYLDALDPQHFFFTQSDLEEFEAYRYELDNLVKKGGSHPGRIIFRRFRTRLDQQYDFVIDLLKKHQFAFDGADTYLIDRKEETRPETLEEARNLWKARLRYEYLQEKLSMKQPGDVSKDILKLLKEDRAKDLATEMKDKLGDERIKKVEDLMAKAAKDKTSPEDTVAQVEALIKKENHREIVKVISRRYNRILRTINDYDNGDVLELFLTSLSRVYDPHSDYMGPAALENFSIGMKLSLFGIGALLRSEDGYCKIVSLTANGPAEKGKELKPNDRIIAVAQGDGEPVDVVDMKLSKVVNLIRGEKGTEVRLTVIPADAPDPSVRKIVSLIRDQIKLEDQEAKAKIFEVPVEDGPNLRLGLIDLPSFYASFDLAGQGNGGGPKSTTSDVAKLIRKLKEEKVSGLILDLRRNGGGSLEEAINLTGLFIKEGPVVQVRDPSGRVFVDDDPDPSIFYKGPLVVLTSRFSASASEILAGALQDYGRAIIVGDTSTHGKGTVQSLIQLGPILQQRGLIEDADAGAIKITIRKFYRASGASTQLKGVEPDIVLPSLNNHADVGEASLKNALPWNTIDAAEYERYDWIASNLPVLRKRSENRVAASEDFAYIRKEIERYKEKLEVKTVSMNESKRRNEKKEADQRIKDREKQLADRPDPTGTVYEISLKDTEKPGLPDPDKASEEADPKSEADPKADPDPDPDPKKDPATDEDGKDETEEETKKPVLDVTLEEAKQILTDLIRLATGQETLTASTPGSDTSTNN